MSLLQGGNVTIAGKRIPFSVLAVLAAVGAALLVVRQMRTTQSAVSLGMPSGFYEAGGYQVGLDSLNDALRRIDDKLNNGQTPTPPPAPLPEPLPASRTVEMATLGAAWTNLPGHAEWLRNSLGGVLFSAPEAGGRMGFVPYGSRVEVLEIGTGRPIEEGGPNTWLKIRTPTGQVGWLWSADVASLSYDTAFN